MVAIAERPDTLPPIPPGPAATAGARALALGFLRYASACWRGDPGADIFGIRLGAYWSSELPPAPREAPDAVSPHGGGGRGILWHQIGGEVLGYIPGSRGGYRVPVVEIPRLVRCTPCQPRAIQDRAARRPQWSGHQSWRLPPGPLDPAAPG